MIPVTECPHCLTRVIAVESRCPACGKDIAAAAAPAQPAGGPSKRPPPRRRRHPIIVAIGGMLIASGFVRWGLVGIDSMIDVFWNLVLIWAGTLVLLLLNISNWLAERKQR